MTDWEKKVLKQIDELQNDDIEMLIMIKKEIKEAVEEIGWSNIKMIYDGFVNKVFEDRGIS